MHTATKLGEQLPLNILLVEDNLINQRVAMSMLRQLGYKCDVAVDGQEALDAVARTVYDLIIMDVQMPRIDGLEATRRIRKIPAMAKVKIIAMTAHVLVEDRNICIRAGMDDYLSKPVRMADLEETIKRTMEAAQH